jgi:O-antigen/teichoic acid export membrane protein
VNYIIKIISTYFFNKTPQGSESDRSWERYRRIGKTALSSVIANVVNISTGLITVPVTLSYLGVDKFGVWMTVTGFVAFLSFTDLGLGVGLQNALSRCDGQDNKRDPAPLVTTAMVMMFGIAFLLCLFTLVFLPFLPIQSIVKVKTPEANQVLLSTMQAVILVFAFGLPTGLVQKILTAYQDGYLANLLLACGRFISLAGVFVCAWMKADLPVLVAVYMGGPFIVLGCSSIYVFSAKPFLRPNFKAIKLRYLREIARTGLLVMAAQVGAVIMVNGPTLLLANRFGTTDIVPFILTQQMVGMVSIILSVVLAPLWPAYGEAGARGDIAWVIKTFRRSLWFTGAVTLPLFIVIAVLGRFIIHLWTGLDAAVPSWSLLMACNVWALFKAWNFACAMLLNGLNQMTGQAVYGVGIPIIAVMIGFFVAAHASMERVIWTMVVIGEILRGGCFGAEAFWTLKKRGAFRKR